MGAGEVVPCHQCGGYRGKVRNRVWLTLRRRGKVTLLITLLTVTLVIAFKFRRCYYTHRSPHQRLSMIQYDRMLPLIFIGGVPGSGSSLLKLYLDDHPDIRCRSETRIIPRVLRMYKHWITDHKEHSRLEEAGVTAEVLQSAVTSMLLDVLLLSGEVSSQICSQDPLSLYHADYLSQIFPRSRFLWVIRDGRALVHSLISRQLHASGWSFQSMDQDAEDNLRNLTSTMMEQWNTATLSMLDQCRRVGPGRCRAVGYEQLLLRPRDVLRDVLAFLNVSWDENVLKSDIGRKYRFSQSRGEAGTTLDQSFLRSWQDELPADVLKDLQRLAPALDQLGFDPADYLRHSSTRLEDLFIAVNKTLDKL